MAAIFRITGLIINLFVCGLLLLSCYATRIGDGNYWFAGLFALATVYFLAGVLFFLLLWLFIKKIYLLPGIVTLLLCFNPLKQVIPFRYTPGFNTEKTNRTLRVMSWNVEHFNIRLYKEHPEVKPQMIELINHYRPDVACFQEMVAGDSERNRINYVSEFQRKLGIKYVHFSYRNEYDFDDNHHFGTIILSRYPIIASKIYKYPPFDYNSVFQTVDIVKGKDTVRVFNVHLQTLRFTQDNIQYIDDPIQTDKDNIKESRSIIAKFKHGFIKRHRQADRIRKVMDDSKYPIILCGDFNDVPNSYAYNTIGKNMQNAFVEAGYGIGSTFSGILPILRIDQIFYSNQFEIKQFTRIPKKLSDHFPIIADLEIKK